MYLKVTLTLPFWKDLAKFEFIELLPLEYPNHLKTHKDVAIHFPCIYTYPFQSDEVVHIFDLKVLEKCCYYGTDVDTQMKRWYNLTRCVSPSISETVCNL